MMQSSVVEYIHIVSLILSVADINRFTHYSQATGYVITAATFDTSINNDWI